MTPWPTTLPSPLIGGAQMGGSPRSEVTEMEGGWIRRRRQYLEPRKVWNVGWNLTGDQFVAFKEFFDTDLENGSLPFSLYMIGGTKRVVFADSNYSFTRSDNLFAVQASLEVVADSNWILVANVWDDTGDWEDTEVWND